MSTGLIATADLNDLLDSLVTAYRRIVGTSGSGFGMGSPGGSFGGGDLIQDAVDVVYGSGNEDVIDALGRSVRGLQDALDPALVVGIAARNLIRELGRHAYEFQPHSSVVSLDTLLTYRNTVGVWDALQDVFFYDIFYQALNLAPSPCNLYQEILQGAFTDGLDHLYTNGMGKFVATGAGTGNFTAAVVEGELVDGGGSVGSIDYTKCAGGFPQIRAAGLAGSGNLTVTGIGFDPATGEITASKTWVTNITGAGPTPVTVGGGTAPADCLIIKVTNMAIAAGITAGTFYVEAARPTGRPLID